MNKLTEKSIIIHLNNKTTKKELEQKIGVNTTTIDNNIEILKDLETAHQRRKR